MKKIIQSLLVALFCLSVPANATLVTLNISFDDFSSDTGFGIWDFGMAPSLELLNDPNESDYFFDGVAYDLDLSSTIGFGDGYALPGDFDVPAGGTYQFVWDLGPGDYVFAIVDAMGNGICCESGDGFFELSIGGDVIVGGGAFSTFDAGTFNVPIPIPGALLLFGSALLGFVGYGRKQ